MSRHPSKIGVYSVVTLSCLICNTRFKAKRRSALYCSDNCKTKAYRIRKGLVPLTEKEARAMVARHSTEKTCCFCGRQYWTAGKGRPPKFCSDGCREGYRKSMIRALTYFVKAHSDAFDTLSYTEVRALLSKAENRKIWDETAHDLGYWFVASMGSYVNTPDFWGVKR